jgi:hypothetical protein
MQAHLTRRLKWQCLRITKKRFYRPLKLAVIEARWNGDHDIDPGMAPVHYTTYQVINAISKLIAVIETQQVQINSLMQAVPQAGKREV